MGRIHTRERQVLGGKGGKRQKQAVQSFRYSIHYEKAMVERLKEVYHVNWFAEDGESYPVRVFLLKDEVTVGLDGTGESLHKRGYRKLTARAPIAENLAAAMIMLTPWNKDRILIDPFCGSGTIPIEAAMMAAQIAPGMKRDFTFRRWKTLFPKVCLRTP